MSESSLEEEVREFRSSNEEARYIDRHVESAEAAVALAKTWFDDRARLIGPDTMISKPIVIIDDEWIHGEPDAPPPHVWICLATHASAFRPWSATSDMVPMRSSGVPIIDALLTAGVRLWRGESSDPGDPNGCWFLELVGR